MKLNRIYDNNLYHSSLSFYLRKIGIYWRKNELSSLRLEPTRYFCYDFLVIQEVIESKNQSSDDNNCTHVF